MTVAITLPLTRLAAHEEDLIRTLSARLEHFQTSNLRNLRYYNGRQRLRDLGISIPPSMRNIETVVGWAGIAVDVLEERLDWQGWVTEGGDPFDLDPIYTANRLQAESSLIHLDALVCGVGFSTVGTGWDGEPDPLITVESPMKMTGTWDSRARRLSNAMSVQTNDEGGTTGVSVYLPDETIVVERDSRGRAVVADRDQHNLGRPLAVMFRNRPTGADRQGRSEITRPIRTLTDAAVRTLVGMEVAREFFAAPQRWVMGASESSFVDQHGNPIPAWESYLGRILALEADDEGTLPTVGQFSAGSPDGFTSPLRVMAQTFSAEAAIPANYLGYATDNPASADAIKAGETRLIKRAERRQTQFDAGHIEEAQLAFMVREGVRELPAEFVGVSCSWGDPSTPTAAASADAAVKLVASGVLPAQSEVTWEMIGLSAATQKRLAADLRREQARGALELLRAGSDSASAAMDPADTKAAAEALGQLIRAGVDPHDAARRVGLEGIKFTGAIPVSLRPTEPQASRLED